MSLELIIDEISVQRVECEGAPSCIDVDVTVRNESKTRTFYIVTEIRAVEYEESSHTLSLYFSERDSGEFDRLHLYLPHIAPILPSEIKCLHLHLPIKLKRMRGRPGKRLEYDEIDLSRTSHVALEIAFDPTPFRPRLKQAPDQIADQFRNWGSRMKGRVSVRFPGVA